MQFHPNEIFLLYNPASSSGKQTRALAKSMNSHVNEVDALHEKLGPTYWKEVVNMLGLEPKELLDRSHPEYQAKVAGNTYTMNGWLDVLMHNPHLLKAPIAIYNGKAILCQQPNDVLKLEKAVSKVPPHLRKE
ncbi:MAG: glutaredoxin [Cyclobacteriaceae bacterium]|nr:glutaredoxin [Cyclobacteriaceae bacterium]